MPIAIPSIAFTVFSFAVALGVLVFVHELGHFTVAKRIGVRVLRFSIGFGPVIFSRRRGETEYALSAVPMGGYVKMLGEDEEGEEVVAPEEEERSFANQSVASRAAIVFAGPGMNLVFAFVVYALLFIAVGVDMPSNAPVVGGVTPGLPAAETGLLAGDRITAVNGQSITTWEELSKSVLGSNGERLHLQVEREGGQQLTLDVTPALQESRNLFGESMGSVYRIGIEASHEWTQVGPVKAVGMAAEQTWTAATMVVKGLFLMFRGRVPLRELGGPIAIARAAGQQARAGFRYFLSMLAFLSINLAVLNLLPIPALDGGHLAFFAVEAVMRRPLRPQHRELAQRVGLLVLITLMVFVFYNDIHRLVQG